MSPSYAPTCRLGYEEYDGTRYCFEHGGFAASVIRETVTLPFPVTRPESWSEDAACARPDVEPAWFDAGHEDESRDARRNRHARAKAVCRDCPVTAECADAIVPGDEGIRGGQVIGERQRGPHVINPNTPIREHGTPTGAQAHRRRGEKPCEPCAVARNQSRRAQRAKKKAS